MRINKMFPLNAITGKAGVCISIMAASTTPHVIIRREKERPLKTRLDPQLINKMKVKEGGK